MSPQDSTDARPGIPAARPKTDIYTVMLILALVAILTSIACLWLEMRRYDYDIQGPSEKFRAAIEQPRNDRFADAGMTDVWLRLPTGGLDPPNARV